MTVQKLFLLNVQHTKVSMISLCTIAFPNCSSAARFRLHCFPFFILLHIPAKLTQTLRNKYKHLCTKFGQKLTFVLLKNEEVTYLQRGMRHSGSWQRLEWKCIPSQTFIQDLQPPDFRIVHLLAWENSFLTSRQFG